MTPSVSKLLDPWPFIMSGLSQILIVSEKIFWLILSFKNDVPLEITDADIAPAKVLSRPLAILLSKIIAIFSLPIFFGLNFLKVY